MTPEERAAKIEEMRRLEAFIAQAEADAQAQQQVQQQPINAAQTHAGSRAVPLPQEPAADPNTPWHEDITRGLGLSAAETALGIKGLVSELTPENESALKLWRDDVRGSGGFGTAGGVIGELAQVAMPASKIHALAKASKLARTMPATAATGAVLGDVGLMSGFGALQAPTEEKTRGEKAVENAVFSLAGGAAGGVLNKALKGASKTKSGEELLNMGVPLTPAQATDSGLIKALEFTMGITPLLAKSVAQQKEKSLIGFNKVIAQAAAPKGIKITAGGQEGMRQVRDAYKRKYQEAWSKAEPFSEDQLIAFMDQTKNMRDELGESANSSVRKIDDALDRVDRLKTTESMENLDTVVREQIERADSGQNPDFDLADYLTELRQTIQNTASPQTASELAELNSTYGGFRVARRATANTQAMKKGGENKGIYSTDELTQAVRSIGGETRSAINTAPLQSLMNLGTDTIGDRLPVPLLDAWKTMARKMPAPNLMLEPAARVVLGDTAAQKKTKAVADFLRNYGVSGATLGGAYGSVSGD